VIPWSWQIALYLWLAGMAGGAYCTAFLVDRASDRKQKQLLQIATWIGVPMVLLGSLLLTLELGQGMRFWHLFTEFSALSPMSIGSWLLPLWAIIGIALIALWFAEAFESADPVVTIIEFDALIAFLVGLGAARKVITTGTLGLLFWVGAVLYGVLVPLSLETWPKSWLFRSVCGTLHWTSAKE